MNNINRHALVYINNIPAGILKEIDEGYDFTYNDEYFNNNNLSLSLTMLLSKKTYQSSFLFPFFDGLIPEGFLLETIVHNWKLDYKDRFGILLVSCRDPIGNVRLEVIE